MNQFHAGYHLLATALQYIWGVIIAIGVYVVLPILALAFIVSVLNSIPFKGKRPENEDF